MSILFLRSRGAATTLVRWSTGRNRRNREALLEAGRSIDHAFSVRELHEAARRDQPRIGLTTAYRGDRALARRGPGRGGRHPRRRGGVRDVRRRRPPPPPGLRRVRRGRRPSTAARSCRCARRPSRSGSSSPTAPSQSLPGRCARCAAHVSALRDAARAAASPVFGVPLSVLDVAPVSERRDARRRRSPRRPPWPALVERLGYHRLWYAEHHNMPGIASSAPEVLIANAGRAARTGSASARAA